MLPTHFLQAEALLSTVSNTAIDFMDTAAMTDAASPLSAVIVVASSTGHASALVSKYRPPCPVVVATNSDIVFRQTSGCFAQFPLMWDRPDAEGLAEVRARKRKAQGRGAPGTLPGR